MLRSCSACGKIHDEKIKCNQKLALEKKRGSKKITHVEKFRWSKIWKDTAEDTKKRDLHFCRVCLTKQYGTVQKYTTRDLSVHHIVPLVQNFDRRLDRDNLITLCRVHHEMAESGHIPRDYLHTLARCDVLAWLT